MFYREMAMPMSIPGAELMGNNVRGKLKFCGKGVQLYPWSKIVHAENTIIDDYSRIYDHVYIDAGPSLTIGKWCILTWQVIVEGGGITCIGDRVFIGPGSKLLSGTGELNGYCAVQNIRDISELEVDHARMPEECYRINSAPITLEDDAYVGAGCIIMAGTIIHEGAVVGANSFVRGELEPWTIYVGSPCRPIGKRVPLTEECRQGLQKLDWTKRYIN